MRIKRYLKKKGFTLVELLAVIIILAVIATVLFAMIQDIILSVRKEALRLSARGYSKGMTTKCNVEIMDSSEDNDDIYNGKTYTFDYMEPLFNNTNIEDGHLTFTYNYTGAVETFTVPSTGEYKLELWGGQGGSISNYIGGYGGYSTGTVSLTKGQVLYIAVGGKGAGATGTGQSLTGGWNGGGSVSGNSGVNHIAGAGGGATHIALNSNLGELKNYEDNKDDILIVAGGGGGPRNQSNHVSAARWGDGGSGGGFKGGKLTSNYGTSSLHEYDDKAGTQESGYKFGLGAIGYANGAGGGGYWGGHSGDSSTYYGSGSGGSGFINNNLLSDKKMVCFNCTENKENAATYTENTTCHNSNAQSDCTKEGTGLVKITFLGDYTNLGNMDREYQKFEVPADGVYTLEVWGAQGGDAVWNDGTTYQGGYGGYSTGEVRLVKGQILYIAVGGEGQDSCNSYCLGGFNGGGNAKGAIGSTATTNAIAGSGGGATHIVMDNNLGELRNYVNDKSHILIVAGGGGGSFIHRLNDGDNWWRGYGGSAGGYKSVAGNIPKTGRSNYPTIATQSNGGTGYNQTSTIGSGIFGAAQVLESSRSDNWAGAGGGYYGGGSSIYTSTSGGSGYIGNKKLFNKAMFCYGCEEIRAIDNIYTVSTTGTSEQVDRTNCPDGYKSSATSKCAKVGNGYAKITIKQLDTTISSATFSVISKDKEYQTDITLEGYVKRNNADSFYGNSVPKCDNEVAVYSRSLHLCAWKQVGSNNIELIDNNEDECVLTSDIAVCEDCNNSTNYTPTNSTGYLCGNIPDITLTEEKYFTFNQSTGTITGYSSEGPKDVVIPCKIGGVNVTRIASNAFKDKGLKSVIMPDTITRIDDWAFANNSISKLELGQGLVSIGGTNTFASNNIKVLVFPDSLKTIEDGRDGYAAGSYLYGAFLYNPIEVVVFGSGIEHIGVDSFHGVTSLKTVDFSRSTNLKTIGKQAFYNTRVTDVTINSNLQTIGENAFLGDSALATVDITTTSTSGLTIGSSSFQNGIIEELSLNGKITSIASDAFKNNQTPDDQAFIMCRNSDGTENSTLCSYAGANRSNITIPDNVTSLASASFNGLGLTGTLNTGNGITTIEANKFKSNSLTNVVIGENVTSIGASAFNSNSISTLTLGSKLTSIGDSAFQYNGIKELTLPPNVKSLNNFAFANNQIETLNLGSVETIGGSNTFASNSIKNLVLPDSLKTIEDGRDGYAAGSYLYGAFLYNPIESVTFGSGIEHIGVDSFHGVTSLTTVDFSRATKLKTIGKQAFYNTRVTDVTINSNLQTIGENAFLGDSALTTVDITTTSTSGLTIGSSSFQNGIIEELSLNGKITSIASDAFKNNQTPDDQAFIMCRNSDGTENSTLCSYAGANRSNITIPDNVTSLASASFNGLGLTGTLNTGDGITAIESNKFQSNSLTTVIIGDRVTTIGENAFKSNYISSLTIGNGLTTIGNAAFQYNRLTELTLPENVKTLNNLAFSDNQIETLNLQGVETIGGTNTFASNKIKNLVLPDSLKTIEDGRDGYAAGNYLYGAFLYNPIESVTFGSGIEHIGVDSFYGVTSLTTADFSRATKLKTIGKQAFYNTRLTDVVINSNLQTIGPNAFLDDPSLTEVSITTTNDNGLTIGSGAFQNGTIEDLTLSGKVVSIASDAFKNNQLPDNQAFIMCRNSDGTENSTLCSYGGANRSNITISDNVTSLVNASFNGLGLTGTLNTGNGITSIEANKFASNSLSTVIIGDNVTSMGSGAFKSNQISSLTIGSGLTTIPENSFQSNRLTELTLPDNVKRVSNWAFSDNQIVTLNLGSVETIGGSNTFGSNSIKNLVIPDSLREIEDGSDGYAGGSYLYGAFLYNPIESITFGSGIEKIGVDAFHSITSLTSIDTSRATKLNTIGKQAFYNTRITYAEIPASVMNVGEKAFASNSALEEIFVRGKVDQTNFASAGSNWNGNCSNVVYEFANCYFYEGDTITGYVAACPKKIEIPSELGGNTITTIAENAFKDIGITQVLMPSTITTIGEDAFSGNTIDPIYVLGKASDEEFTSAATNWNNGAKVIYEDTPQTCLKINNNELTGKYDGYFCNDYKDIVIPNTVTSIAANAFKGYILTNITITDGTRISSFGSNWNGTIYKPTFQGDSAEYNCYTLSGSSITGYKQFCPATVVLGGSIMGTEIDSVANNAFKNAAITDLTIGSNITSIGNNAFEGNDIEEIDFEEGLITIGSSAFKNIGLTKVTIPSSVTTIGDNAFANNPKITQFFVDGKVDENDFADLGTNWNGGHDVIYKGYNQ